MQSCRYVKSICEPALYRHLDLTFHPGRTNLLLTPKAKGALMKNISSVHSLTFGRKELPYLFNALFVFYPPARTLSRGYLPLLQALSVQMTSLTRLEVCLRDRILDGNPDPFPLPPTPNDPRGRLRRLFRIIDASPSLQELDIEGLPITSGIDFLEWQRTIGKLSELRSLCVSILIWSSKVSKRWLREWSNLLAVCPPSIREFGVYRVYFRFPGHEDDFDHYQRSWDDDHDDAGVVMTVAKKILPGRFDDLTRLDIHRDPDDESTTTTDLWQILEGCPNVDSLQLSGFHSGMGGFDLASVIMTGCPSLKRLMYDATSSPVDSNVPFKLMSIMQNGDQIEELVLDALSLNESFLPIARMGLQKHAESLRVIRLSNCSDNQPSRNIALFLTECSNFEEFDVLPTEDYIESFIDLTDAVAIRPWACTKIRRLLLGVAIPVAPVHLTDTEAEQLGLLERLYRQIGALKELRVLDLRACVATGLPPRPSSSNWNLGRDSFPALLNLENTDTGRPGYLSLLGGLTHLEELRGSVCLTTPECKVTVGLPEARWMNGNWSNLRVAGFFLKGDKPNKPFVWLAKQPRKAKLELTATGLAHS
ncbi:hypothetical protein BGX30_013086 [Mortierella sp. GBA39]|nr:hypothetical protein BGX30_013086 [Mortierella sp. GBA39]